MGHIRNEFSETSYQKIQTDKELGASESAIGKLSNARDVQSMPASHGKDKTIIKICIIAAVIFLGSIAMWAVGASVNIVGLELAGKIFFGLSITAIAIALVTLGLWVCWAVH